MKWSSPCRSKAKATTHRGVGRKTWRHLQAGGDVTTRGEARLRLRCAQSTAASGAGLRAPACGASRLLLVCAQPSPQHPRPRPRRDQQHPSTGTEATGRGIRGATSALCRMPKSLSRSSECCSKQSCMDPTSDASTSDDCRYARRRFTNQGGFMQIRARHSRQRVGAYRGRRHKQTALQMSEAHAQRGARAKCTKRLRAECLSGPILCPWLRLEMS